MVNDHWRSVRETTTQVHVEYGPASATLFATEIRLRRGPPIALALSLEGNLRTRTRGSAPTLTLDLWPTTRLAPYPGN
jgi:hypothetical protein